MNILISGATGFIGSALIEALINSNYQNIRVLTRDKKQYLSKYSFPVEVFEWDIKRSYIEEDALENVDVVIHLAGESVAEGKWSNEKKENILESRVNGSNLLMKAIYSSSTRPKKFISASAIGIYGDRGEERLTDKSPLGDDYLADVCKKWENSCLDHNFSEMKSICLRIGIVLGENGGALKKMLPPFKAGIAGVLGSGDQYMSWIHIDDLVGQIKFLIENENQSQIYNGVSPRPVSNLIFTKILGRILNRPTLIPIPKLALRTVFGEMSQILTNSQKVIPENFLNEGYNFKYRSLKDALRDILKFNTKNEKILKKYQWISKSPEEVFKFFSNAKNLEQITPSSLNFKVLNHDNLEIKEGTLINYKLKLHGMPLKWQSRINQFDNAHSFEDQQLVGPYSKWVHKHDFIPYKGGTLMRDRVVYKVPFGKIGDLLSGFLVKTELERIFNYRKKVINELFN